MAEFLGNVEIPEIPISVAAFPLSLTPDWAYVKGIPRVVHAHLMHQAGNLKREQRYLAGDGVRTWNIGWQALTESRREALRDFWEDNLGAYGQFYFRDPGNGDNLLTITDVTDVGGLIGIESVAHGLTTGDRAIVAGVTGTVAANDVWLVTVVDADNLTLDDSVWDAAYTGGGTIQRVIICRFADQSLSWEMLSDFASRSQVTLAEVPDPELAPRHVLTATVTRFPSAALATALEAQAQEVIPLIRIVPKETGYPEIFISDRRVKIAPVELDPEQDILYQPRLVDWGPISQGIGSESDQANFVLGNADRVMTALANEVDLFRARLEFSLFHVGTGIKVDLWAGDMTEWDINFGPTFHQSASDGLYELNLAYPPRRATRTCWKEFNDTAGAGNCPASAEGGLNLGDICDKGFNTPLGCVYHNMTDWFGGVIVNPQAVRIKDNSTGTWGFGRSRLTSVSQVADSVYDEVMREVYCDFSWHPDATKGIPVNAKIAAGRDEGDFQDALGIVGEGPIKQYAQPDLTAVPIKFPHTLDGQPPHGLISDPRNTAYGIRLSHGHDPVRDNDPDRNSQYFSLGEGGEGKQVYEPLLTDAARTRAAGTAFAEIRRVDQKGLQPENAKLSEHKMQVTIRRGLMGWRWTDTGDHLTFTRSTADVDGNPQEVLTNPVWIAVNALLRAKGLLRAPAAEQLQHFDVVAVASSELVGLNISGATNATPIVIETETPHLFPTGRLVDIADVLGNTAANGLAQTITVIDATHFSLDGSVGNGAYTAGTGVVNGKPAGSALIADLLVDTTIGSLVIEDATYGEPTLIESTAHGLKDGMVVRIDGVDGITDGTFYLIERVDDDNIRLLNSNATGTYVDGGTINGKETQFTFTGIIEEEKPLRDWLTEILMGALGFYTFTFGKLSIRLRTNSSARSAYTTGNVIYGSLQASPLKPGFNHLTGNFADQEFDFVNNSVLLYDIDHAKMIGGFAPQYLKGQINLAGVSGKSQCFRVVRTKLAEELGGISAAQRKYARYQKFSTTILGLDTEPGMVVSLSGIPGLPTYPATDPDNPDEQIEQAQYLEMRVMRWTLNKDYSIDIEGPTTHNDIYQWVVGPKPADVMADPVPPEFEGAPAEWSFDLSTDQKGNAVFDKLACKKNRASVHMGIFEVYYVDEAGAGLGVIQGANMDADDTTFAYKGEAPILGEPILVDAELMLVLTVTPDVGTNEGTCTVERGYLGTTPAAHVRSGQSAITAINEAWPAEVTVGAGLNLQPGERHGVVLDPGGREIRATASYDATTGKLFVQRPFDTAVVGDEVYADPRIWRVRRRDVLIPIPPRFFLNPGRSDAQFLEWMPFAGLVFCRGYLENTRGARSLPETVSFVGTTGHRERTLGTTEYRWPHDSLPSGEAADLFQRVTTKPQCWERAYAERIGGAEPPIDPPPALKTLTLSIREPLGGTITLGGTPAEGDRIWVTIGTGTQVFVRVPMFTVGATVTLLAVGQALTEWLNSDPNFQNFYVASDGAAGVVKIADRGRLSGTIAVEVEGGVTATPNGINSTLGILVGRRYRCSNYASSGGWESELGPISESTGPTGDASQVEFIDPPRSADERVDFIRVYAQPDIVLPARSRSSDGPWYLVAEVPNGEGAWGADTTTEAGLSALDLHVVNQPPALGPIVVKVRRGGQPWLEMRIQTTEARSNVINGLSMDPAGDGDSLTVDVDNESGPVGLALVLQ